MKIGVSKAIISPESEVDLAGFATPDRKSIGAHDDLFLNVMVMEHGGKRAAIICADIIGFDMGIVKDLKNIINHRFGFRDEEVFFNASHTHSGPQTLKSMLSVLGLPDENYLSFFNNKLLSAFEDALNNLEEAELFTTVIKSDVGISRRLISEGTVLFAPNEDVQIDQNVAILKFCTKNGVKAVMFNYACHPSTVRTKYITADYPGHARKVIEDHFGNGTVAFFVQGCCGDVKVRNVQDGRFRGGTWEDIDSFGESLGQGIINACEGNMQKVDNVDIATSISYISLPLESIPERQHYEDIKLESGPGKTEYAEKMLQNYEKLQNSRPFIIHKISISDRLMFIGMSGEVCSPYSIFMREALPDGILVAAGYTNGTEGYIPTETMFEEGGYEPDQSYLYFSFPSKFDRSIERILKEHIKGVMEE